MEFHAIKEMRYSVPGLPCLYLGGSTHVCWRELGEPDFDTISVARYFATRNTDLHVLNFGHRLPLFASWVKKEPNRLVTRGRPTAIIAAHVTCWPLIAICAIRVPDRSIPGRPEYAIPQLVLKWITTTRQFHGVRYFSTQYQEYEATPLA